MDQLRPHAGLFGLSVLVSDVEDKLVEDGWAEIRLEAPMPGNFLSTDIPQVEGTRLVELRLPIQQGKAEWQYSWPIRGDYRLAVMATSADGKKASKAFAITVRESSAKWWTLGMFGFGLFLLGFIAGRILTVTKASVASLTFMLILTVRVLSPYVAYGSQAGEQAAQATLTVEAAVVGKPSRITWRLQDNAGMARKRVTLSLAITQLEENQAVFALERIPVTDEFTLKFQFVDGSQHQVTAVAELPGQAPIRNEQHVAVTAVEPPTSAALAPIVLFLGVIAFGLGVGRWSKLYATN